MRMRRFLAFFKAAFHKNRDGIRFLLASCAIMLGCAFLLVFKPGAYVYFESKMFDLLVQKSAAPISSESPVMISLDDESMAKFGQWPWPRHLIQRLLQTLHDAGAKTIVLDVLFAEADRTSFTSPQDPVFSNFGVLANPTGAGLEFMDHDLLLSQTIATTRAVLGYKLLFKTNGRVFPTADFLIPLMPHTALDPAFQPFHALSVLGSIPVLSRATPHHGFINSIADIDGVLRRVPMVIRYGDSLFPSLDVAAVNHFEGEPGVQIARDLDGFSLVMGNRRVPIDRYGNCLIQFRGGRDTFPSISASKLLMGEFTPDGIRGRMVLIGPTASGLGDTHTSVHDRNLPGLEVHANIIDNILKGDFLRVPLWSLGAELFMLFCAGVCSTIMLLTVSPLVCFGGVVVGAVALWQAALLFQGQGYLISPLGAEITLILNMVVLSFIKFALEERKLWRSNRELVKAQEASIIGLTSLAETRSLETGNHIDRTRHYVRVLAEELALMGGYENELDEPTIELLTRSAPLHDIGKVGIPDSILLKKGPLTAEEFEIMKQHTVLGFKALQKAEQHISHQKESFLSFACQIAHSHHERWDGAGYPEGLAGKEIPLAARIMALADVYDALTSVRTYKDAYSHEVARDIIVEGCGTQFDPDVVDAFLRTEKRILRIKAEFS